MALRLTNTLTGTKEEFKPFRSRTISMYVCGVTVYDHCHIGHARGAVVFDVLRRYLAHQFPDARIAHIRNITDIDDKIIDRARQEKGGDLKAAAKKVALTYEESFRNDFERLNLLSPSQEPRATEFIPKMVAFIEELIRLGAAYAGSDGVYFSVRKIKGYGKLSHQSLDEMKVGVRGESGEGKKDPFDFALWKRAKIDEPAWESPWGPGRPGWHIECSTMATSLLGDPFDIHGGGQDLVFPHHENEIAQAEGAGKSFARVWLHNGLLTVGGQKMSKSLGNFITIGEALKKHSAEVLRLFFLSAHYRSPLDFTWDRFDEAAHAYERLYEFLTKKEDSAYAKQRPEAGGLKAKFHAAMEDDLNTPEAMSSLYELVRCAQGTQGTARELAGILGFSFPIPEVPPEIKDLLLRRDAARRSGDYARSDQIRRQLNEQGYIVEDTSGGTVVRRKI